MSIFQIDKQFDFCYGHRVFNQKLDADLSCNGLCKCRHLHGHNGCLKIGLEAKDLERGMVTDFKNLECIKVLVDDIFDHKFIIGLQDPLFIQLTGASRDNVTWDEAYHIGKFDDNLVESIALSYSDPEMQQAIRDKMHGFVVVDFVPTSERLCEFFASVAQERMAKILGDRIRISYVDFWETPKSHCRWTPETPETPSAPAPKGAA